jgi:hypothetical protein
VARGVLGFWDTGTRFDWYIFFSNEIYTNM